MDEVPQAGPVVPINDTAEAATLALIQEKATEQKRAAEAYSNARLHKTEGGSANGAHLAHRVIVGAQFYPAHPSRFRVRGKGRGRKFKYFVFHRPGKLVENDVLKAQHYLGKKSTKAKADPPSPKEIQTLAFKWAKARCGHPGVIKTFRIPNRPASTHFVTGYAGELVQMIDLDDESFQTITCRHPTLSGEKVSNSNSLGVELAGPVQMENVRSPFTKIEYQVAAKLIKIVSQIYGMPMDTDHFLLHSDLDPKKKDPGENFKVQKALDMAKALPAFTKFYQAPVDILEADKIAATKFALSFMGIPSTVFHGTASDMAAFSRAMGISTATRADYLQSSSDYATKVAAQLGITSARFSRQITNWNLIKATPQENRTGVAFDPSIGEWE